MSKPLIIYFNDEKMVKAADDQSKFLKKMKQLAKDNSLSVNSIEDFGTLINNLPNTREVYVFIHIMGDALGERVDEDLQGVTWAISLKQDYPHCNYYFVTSNPTKTSVEIHDKKKAYNINNVMNKIFVEGSTEFLPQKIQEIRLGTDMSYKTDSISTGIEKDYQIAILCALADDELNPFRKAMTVSKKIGYEDCVYKQDLYQTKLKLYAQNRMSMVDASIFTSKIISQANPKIIIMAGVCGGRKSEKVKLYDIIIPEHALDIVTGQYKAGDFLPYGYSEKVNEDFIKHIKTIVTDKDFIHKEMYNLIPNEKFDREKEILKSLTIHFDVMACGPFVLKTDNFLEQKATAMNQKIKGFEMESYGVLRAVELLGKGMLALIVKSVMDYTDSKKADIAGDVNTMPNSGISEDAKSEVPQNENIKELASYMSSICTRALLPHIEKYIASL